MIVKSLSQFKVIVIGLDLKLFNLAGQIIYFDYLVVTFGLQYVAVLADSLVRFRYFVFFLAALCTNDDRLMMLLLKLRCHCIFCFFVTAV